MNNKSLFIKSREDFFNKVVDNFSHKKLSNLIVSHEIDEKIFKKFSNEVIKYYTISKKFNFANMTPNGKLVPKKEIELEFNNILILYRDLLDSMNLTSQISRYVIPAIRYKEPSINTLNADRSSRSELPHSDSWAGWGENCLLINIPIYGDTKKNKVIYYKMPDDARSDFMEKRNFDEGYEYSRQCSELKLPYEIGNIYLSDISVIHKTSRVANAEGRLSIDIPILFKYDKNIKNIFLNSDEFNFISVEEMQSLGKSLKLSLSSRMGSIDDFAFEFDKI
jgi:hypothetical protein